MYATKVAFILASLAGLAVVHAAPAEVTAEIDPDAVFKPTGGLKFLSSETVGDDKLYWFGIDDDAAATADEAGTEEQRPLDGRCGNSFVQCDWQNVPNSDTCTVLLRHLSTAPSVAASSRSVCMASTRGPCCTSWTHGSILYAPDLVSASSQVLNDCVRRQYSGLVRGIYLAGVCNTQCLSNRADPCR